ncbi:MAG: hypothetical protein ICV64_06860 [Thermoleophilia bacterium]|nr:hypothetical protein [Thermoleophilia bacterium]
MGSTRSPAAVLVLVAMGVLAWTSPTPTGTSAAPPPGVTDGATAVAPRAILAPATGSAAASDHLLAAAPDGFAIALLRETGSVPELPAVRFRVPRPSGANQIPLRRELVLLDVRTRRERVLAAGSPARLSWGYAPVSASWAPDGRHLAVAGEVSGRGSGVRIVDAATGASRPLAELSGPIDWVAWSPDGARLLVAWRPDKDHFAVDVIDAASASRRRLALLLVGRGDESVTGTAWGETGVAPAPAWAPDGHRIAVVHAGADRTRRIVSVIDTETAELTTVATVPGFDEAVWVGFARSGDALHVASTVFAAAGGEIRTLAIPGGEDVRARTLLPGIPKYASLSPDGSRVAGLAHGEGDWTSVYVAEVEHGLRVLRELDKPKSAYSDPNGEGPTWSPERVSWLGDDTIAFSAQECFHRFRVVTARAAGRSRRALTQPCTIRAGRHAAADVLRGDAGDDELVGRTRPDRLYGGRGSDGLFGGGGSDVLVGGPGADYLSGGTRHDRLYGGPGNDILDGWEGSDLLVGGAGHDYIVAVDPRGRRWTDGVLAGPGNDVVHARDRARDDIRCGPGRDHVVADRIDRVARDCERVERP